MLLVTPGSRVASGFGVRMKSGQRQMEGAFKVFKE